MAPFRHRLRVRYHECDPQGAVFNAHYLAYFDIAITELWRAALGGYETMLAAGVDMVVAEASVRYRAPLRFDEEFDVVAAIEGLGNTSMTTAMRLERDGELVAEGELRHVFVTAGGGEKTAVPDEVRRALEPYAAAP